MTNRFLVLLILGTGMPSLVAQAPKTWDDAALASLEVPLANPAASPKHVSAAYCHAPPLATQADCIKAGEMVFDASVGFDPAAGYTIQDVRDPAWHRKSAVPVTNDGIMRFFYYVVRKKGTVEIASFGCGTCHTRVMPDGAVLKGPQGNFPIDRTFAGDLRQRPVESVRTAERRVFGAP